MANVFQPKQMSHRSVTDLRFEGPDHNHSFNHESAYNTAKQTFMRFAICISAMDKADVTKVMQDDLNNVNSSYWLCANRLSLHIGKTSCMLVTSAQRRRRMSHDYLDLFLYDNQIKHFKTSHTWTSLKPKF